MGWLTAVTFIWKIAVPQIRAVVKLVGTDTYQIVRDAVEEAEKADMPGLEKRATVFTTAMDYIESKGVPIDGIAPVAVYFLLELAVLKVKG